MIVGIRIKVTDSERDIAQLSKFIVILYIVKKFKFKRKLSKKIFYKKLRKTKENCNYLFC